MSIALVTNYLVPYRVPLFERLAERHDLEVLCFGGGDRYTPSWFRGLDEQLDRAPFPASRLRGPGAALGLGGRYEAVIAPFAGGAIMPAAYAGAKLRGRKFILWASVWAEPRSVAHTLARPATRHIYRHADAIVAYGEHVRRFVAGIRGHDDDVVVAPQSVEAELFGREVSAEEIDAFRRRHDLGHGPLVAYVGRLVPEKGVDVLLEAWGGIDATLIVIGDGPLADRVRANPKAAFIGPLPRSELPVAYAAAEFAVLASVPTERFVEPWGLVCNEAMHQGRAVIATSAVGAAAGGLVVDRQTGLVVAPGDAGALRAAVERLLADGELRARLGAAARDAVAPYNYDAMVEAFERALGIALGR